MLKRNLLGVIGSIVGAKIVIFEPLGRLRFREYLEPCFLFASELLDFNFCFLPMMKKCDATSTLS